MVCAGTPINFDDPRVEAFNAFSSGHFALCFSA